MIKIENPSSGQGNGYIPQYSTDPVSPDVETAWVLRTLVGATGGGTIRAFLGLGFPYLTVGSGASNSYQFSYRTLEATTKRVTIS